ncbi:MAG: sulfatase-like hydrolase/transferase [Candidatus Hydrogenedentota bacterium]
MRRRTFLKHLGGMASACAGISRLAWSANARRKPNILFILVDDLGKDWISCYGAEEVETPNIDALAKGGIRFENAYSMAQCTPSRVTFLTGQYPWRTGWVNHWDVPRWGIGYFDWDRYTTVAEVLEAAGYATVAAGKWQINDFRLAPGAMHRHGFDDWCMWTGYETGNPPSGERYWDPYINTPAGSKTYEGAFGPDVYADALIEFMKGHEDDPMFLYFPMALTHGPLVATPTEPDVKNPRDKHKAMVRYMDLLVGRLVNALDELDLRNDTIIVFTTDNGSAIGGRRHGRKFGSGKAKKWEHGVCMPFVVNCPGCVPAGVVTDALTDFTDLLPTFADLAGAELPNGATIDGVSIAPVILGDAEHSKRDWILSMGHGPAKLDEKGVRGQVDFAERVIRDKRYKVWVNTNRKISRLYDLQTDPYEEHNLIASTEAAHKQALTKFERVVDGMAERDARPQYTPRAPNPWDKKPKE